VPGKVGQHHELAAFAVAGAEDRAGLIGVGRPGGRDVNFRAEIGCDLFGRWTGADLIEVLQASPYRDLDIEPTRFRLSVPVRDVTFRWHGFSTESRAVRKA
jgi:hypothetical protein